MDDPNYMNLSPEQMRELFRATSINEIEKDPLVKVINEAIKRCRDG